MIVRTIAQGEPLELQIRVETKDPTRVSWYRNGEKLKGSKSIRMVYDEVRNTYSLAIDKTSRDKDNAEFKVTIEDENGSFDHSFKVTVSTSRIYFIEKLFEVDVKERDEVLFVVKLSREEGSVFWEKDGIRIVENQTKYCPIVESAYRKLLIKDVHIADEGEYSCIIEETFERSSADLVVNLDRRMLVFIPAL